MKKMMAVWAASLVMLVPAGSLLAHHSLVQFDTTTPVTVRGTVVLFQRVNPHSLLVLDEQQATGQIHRWIIEGPSALQLSRKNIDKDSLKTGDIVAVCGYVIKAGFDPQRAISSDQVRVTGQNMDGELLMMPDGQMRVWSDYGNHKCLPVGYTDLHSK